MKGLLATALLVVGWFISGVSTVVLVAFVSTASAQTNQGSSDQYVHCHARGCQNTDTYPGRCVGVASVKVLMKNTSTACW